MRNNVVRSKPRFDTMKLNVWLHSTVLICAILRSSFHSARWSSFRTASKATTDLKDPIIPRFNHVSKFPS